MFTSFAYVFVIVTIITLFYFRKLQNSRWRVIATRERLKLRTSLQSEWKEAVCATYRKDMDKVLIAKHARLTNDNVGYIYIEIPSLVRWIALADDGVRKILEDCVAELAIEKLKLVLA